MDTQQPIRATTRLTMFGQVAFGAWFVPAMLVGWPLSRSLGHVSGAVLIPLAGQTVLGMLLHGTLLLAGSRKIVGSFLGSLVISILVTSAVFAAILLIYWGQVTGSLELLRKLGLVLYPVALTSSVLGWFLARKELKNPSLE